MLRFANSSACGTGDPHTVGGSGQAAKRMTQLDL